MARMAAALSAPLALAAGCGECHEMVELDNEAFWLASDSLPIYAQGGTVRRVTDPRDGQERWFWWGVHYAEADSCVAQPGVCFHTCTFLAVDLYTSDDLAHWRREQPVLTDRDVRCDSWFGRIGLAPLARDRWALFAQCDSSVYIATASSPLGPFRRHREYDLTPLIGRPDTGDQCVFVDDTDSCFLVCSSGVKPNRTFVMPITYDAATDSVTLRQPAEVYRGEGRTGNCLFKHDGLYYLCASNDHGWDASRTFYLTARHPMGPFKMEGDMRIMRGSNVDYSHTSQTGFFITTQGCQAPLVVYCGERWAQWAGNGRGFYVWEPITFDPEGAPIFNSLSHWKFEAESGLWRVGERNDFVHNGSFEANRYIIPNPQYAYKNELAAWNTEVISGRRVSQGNPRSPRVNRPTTAADRRHVNGKMCLTMTDSVAFERRVTQIVRPTRNVALPNGWYSLRALVRGHGKLKRAELFAEDSDGERTRQELPIDGEWHPVQLDVRVDGGYVLVGFWVKGEPLSRVDADDVQLTFVKGL